MRNCKPHIWKSHVRCRSKWNTTFWTYVLISRVLNSGFVVAFSEPLDSQYFAHEFEYCNLLDVWMIHTASQLSGDVPTSFASRRWRDVMDTWTVTTILMNLTVVSIWFITYWLEKKKACNTVLHRLCNLCLELLFSKMFSNQFDFTFL